MAPKRVWPRAGVLVSGALVLGTSERNSPPAVPGSRSFLSDEAVRDVVGELGTQCLTTGGTNVVVTINA